MRKAGEKTENKKTGNPNTVLSWGHLRHVNLEKGIGEVEHPRHPTPPLAKYCKVTILILLQSYWRENMMVLFVETICWTEILICIWFFFNAWMSWEGKNDGSHLNKLLLFVLSKTHLECWFTIWNLIWNWLGILAHTHLMKCPYEDCSGLGEMMGYWVAL